MKTLRALISAAVILLGSQSPQAVAAKPSVSETRLDRLEIDVVRAEDVRAIKKLQRAYGYYADRGLWDDLADLFTDDATANYPSGGFDGNASIRAMFIKNLGQGKPGLAEGRIYNHTILQPVVDLAPDGATATGRWRVLGMLGRIGGSATWADSLYRFDYVKLNGRWKIRSLIAYAGSGGGYEQGWVLPKPRPAGYVDTSPVRFNLAHPADRPWTDPCEADVSVCLVPFPYPNRGGIKRPENVSAVIERSASTNVDRAADLVQRAQRLEAEQAVQNLQHAYGYYIDRGLWKHAVDLFAPDGSLEVGQAGVYVGRKRIRQSLELSSLRGSRATTAGLRTGQLNDHLQFEPIVDVAPDGRSAKARVFELAFVGGKGQSAKIVQNVHENEYVRRGTVWMIQSIHSYTILATDYDQGWAKSALPAPAVSTPFPPDHPPTVTYEVYPTVYTPPFHFDNPSTGKPAAAAGGNAGLLSPAPRPVYGATKSVDAQLSAAERQVQRSMDYDEIENLQSAYGYYAEKSLWSDIAALFVDDGSLETDDSRYSGRERILAFLRASGPDGPVKGALNSLLQLQAVIHVAPDGKTGRIRSRFLQLTRGAQDRPMWGGGIYENEVVKENGVWKFRRLRVHQTYKVNYKGGWATPSQGEGQLFPSGFTPPFHYRKPNPRIGVFPARTSVREKSALDQRKVRAFLIEYGYSSSKPQTRSVQ